MDYTVHGILQDRILEWVAFPFSRASSQPRDRTQVPHIAGDSLPAEPQGKPTNIRVGSLSLLQGILLIQESNQRLLHCKQIFFTNWAITESISHQICYSSSWFLNGFRVSLISLEVELGVGASPFSRGSSWPRNRTGVSCIAGGFFTNWATREAVYMFYLSYHTYLLVKIIMLLLQF